MVRDIRQLLSDTAGFCCHSSISADYAPPECHLRAPEEETVTSRSDVGPDSHCWVHSDEPRVLDGSRVAVGSHRAATAEAGGVLPALLGCRASSRRAMGSQLRLSWCGINVKLEVVLNLGSSGVNL